MVEAFTCHDSNVQPFCITASQGVVSNVLTSARSPPSMLSLASISSHKSPSLWQKTTWAGTTVLTLGGFLADFGAFGFDRCYGMFEKFRDTAHSLSVHLPLGIVPRYLLRHSAYRSRKSFAISSWPHAFLGSRLGRRLRISESLITNDSMGLTETGWTGGVTLSLSVKTD